MTPEQIAEMFIKAAEVEAKLPEVKGLRENYGRYVLPWVHQVSDINGRGRTPGDSLDRHDDPLEEWRMSWFEEWAKRASPEQIGAWEACLKITAEFLSDGGQRRAIWAWAMAQAGVLYRPASRRKISFARWCRDVEHVSEMTGHRRKNRAIASLASQLQSKADLHTRNPSPEVLPVSPENRHLFAIVTGNQALYSTQPMHTWRDDPSFDKTGMTLQEWRAAKRRQAYAHRMLESA